MDQLSTFEELARVSGFVEDIVTIVGFILALAGGVWAWRRFLRERTFDRLSKLYHFANDLWRVGLRIQSKRGTGRVPAEDIDDICKAREALKNAIYDNRHLLVSRWDQELLALVLETDDEAKSLARTGCMDKLRELRSELQERLRSPF